MDDGLDELLNLSKNNIERQSVKDARVLLEEYVDEFFWKLNDDTHYNEESYGGEIEKGFHPSSICYSQCSRKLVYEYTSAPFDKSMTDVDPKLRRVFDNGSDLHSRWQNYFTIMGVRNPHIQLVGSWKCKGCGNVFSADKEVGYSALLDSTGMPMTCPKCTSRRWKYNEFRLRKPNFRITGKRDGKFIIDGKPYLLEIKSINAYEFQKLLGPKTEHKKQFSFYMWMDGTKEGFFLYECKNTQNIKFFYHKYNSDDIINEIDILQNANDCIDDKILPGRYDESMTDKTCKSCAYRKICKTNFDPFIVQTT